MDKFRTALLAAALTTLACHDASAGDTKAPKAVGVAVPPEAMNTASPGSGPECAPEPAPAPEPAQNTGPGRISTNVTVPRQTQGATFGEKVNQGLQASGGSPAQGAAMTGAMVPGGAVISSRCAKMPDPEPMTTPESTEK